MNASVNFNDKQKSKDWRYRTHNTDLLNPDENKIVYERKSSPKYSDPKYARHGKMRAQEQTNEFSVQIKRKSRDNPGAHFPIAASARTNEFYE